MRETQPIRPTTIAMTSTKTKRHAMKMACVVETLNIELSLRLPFNEYSPFSSGIGAALVAEMGRVLTIGLTV